MTFAGNYQGPLYAPHPDLKGKMNANQLDQLKLNYAEMIVEGLMPVDISELEAAAPDYGVGK